MTRGEVLRLFLQKGGRVVDGRSQTLKITEQSLMDFLAEFEQRRALEVMDTVAEARRQRHKDALNSDILDRRAGIEKRIVG